MSEIKKINKDHYPFPVKYSVCTIVNDAAEYDIMKKSFGEKGFTENCEYIIADNTKQNEFNAYEAISLFLKTAQGEYIIVVHQDVRLIDDIKQLSSCLNDLEKKDPQWAICGNAGTSGYHSHIVHITHTDHVKKRSDLPAKVQSLDENFLVIKAASNMTISADLEGFHLYGTDLCIIAQFLGYSSYVIPFMVLHLSKGNIADLEKYKSNFIKKYGTKTDIGYLQTTCTQFYLSNSAFKNRLCNSRFFFFIIKQFQRYPYLFRRMIRK